MRVCRPEAVDGASLSEFSIWHQLNLIPVASGFSFNLGPLIRGFQGQRRYVLIPHYLVELSYILRFDLF
jgi:hypothetical protein